MTEKSRGGKRPGAGRPTNDRNVPIMVRVSQEAFDKLNRLTKNKAEYIDELIKKQPE